MNLIFRIFLTFNSLSLFFIIFLVNKRFFIIEKIKEWNFLTYFFIPFILTVFSIFLSKKLGKDNLGNPKFIELTNNDFLSNYLAFFFVALSIDKWSTFFICFSLTALFTFFSRVSYFNPIFLVLKYNFYYIHLENNSKIMLITKEKIKSPSDIKKDKKYKRINDYTFME